MSQNDQKKTLVKRILSFIPVAAIALLGFLLYKHCGLRDITREEIQGFIEAKGSAAPLIFILLSFAQVTLIPISGAVTILAGNYLFGAVKAFIYSYIGMTLGAMVSFFLGRLIGRPFVNWIAGGKENADGWIDKLRGREKIIIFFMFLLPVFPDDLLCAIAGMFKYSAFEFFILQVIMRATSIFGTLLFMSGEVIPYNVWGISLVAILTIMTIVCFALSMKHYEKIEKKLNGIFRKKKGK